MNTVHIEEPIEEEDPKIRMHDFEVNKRLIKSWTGHMSTIGRVIPTEYMPPTFDGFSPYIVINPSSVTRNMAHSSL